MDAPSLPGTRRRRSARGARGFALLLGALTLGSGATSARADEPARDPEREATEGDASSDEARSRESAEPRGQPRDDEREERGARERGGEEETPEREEAPDLFQVGDELVVGEAEELFRTGGSVHSVSEEVLEQLDFDDPTSILTSMPGVYVRQEDGYGLRPNIGIRGANAERSRRVTLMEDGVLLAPAPYSAPAAYYFPLVTRMTGVDVYMGPAAIPYGPHTVGGAIDFHDRAIPTRAEGGLDLGLGSTWYGRFHAHYGDANDWGGFLVEAVHLRTDGFRHYDFVSGDPTTGFDRTDIQLRGELHGDLTPDVYHRLEVVFGLGLERSNETYTGLTEADLRADPHRRYGITGDDRMDWWRTRAQARYELLSEHVDLLVTAYRHDFSRVWRRLDGFADGTSLAAVLEDPTTGRNAFYYGVLTGEEEPVSAGQSIVQVANNRAFVSQGIQARVRIRAQTDELRHVIELGVRLHYDEITREHTGTNLHLEGTSIVADTAHTSLVTHARAQSIALSAYGAYQLEFRHLTLTPGVRVEAISGEYFDMMTGLFQITEQAEVLPGLGATYEIVPDLAVFAGVHEGYSPVAPGQPEGVRPERSTNYEIGARYGRVDASSRAQLDFFLSDYDNITGECSGAGGCSREFVDRMFNGDRASILGVEAEGTHTLRVDDVSIPLRASYTYTWTRFRTAFHADSPEFGNVSVGDHLPYVPEHQWVLGAGVEWRMLRANAQASYVSPMRAEASQGPILPGEGTDEQFYLDAMASVEVHTGIRLYVRGENLTNSMPIVTRRPFGARVGRPLLVQGGLEASF